MRNLRSVWGNVGLLFALVMLTSAHAWAEQPAAQSNIPVLPRDLGMADPINPDGAPAAVAIPFSAAGVLPGQLLFLVGDCGSSGAQVICDIQLTLPDPLTTSRIGSWTAMVE
jgi:hypothetical protein